MNDKSDTPAGLLSDVPDSDKRSRLVSLLRKFDHLFPNELPHGLPPTQAACEVVPLVHGSKPPYRRHYRLSPAERTEIERQLALLLEQGLIQPSSSPFGAPVLVVQKPNSSAFRIVFDYREINKLTVKNRWTIPRIQDLYDSFHGKTVYSSLDLLAAYHQIALPASDVPKTAFTCHMGSYEWRVLPEGLSNAPSVFTRTMSQVLAPYIGKFVLVYLDDICILSSSVEEHYQHLEQVFELLAQHRLVLKLSKCAFFKSELKYLGHIISADGIRADPAKLAVIQNWQYPPDKHELRRFIGLVSYFRSFVPHFSRLATPFYHMLKNTSSHEETPALRLAFDTIKAMLVSPPVLAHPDPDQPYELVVDASMLGCGAILVQAGRPVAYYSSKFSPAEVNYTTSEQEMLAVIKALKEWRCYLEGCKGLTVVTDHNPNVYFPTKVHLSRRQARWLEFMSRFTFDWKHTPGVSNPADALSRLPFVGAICHAIESDLVQRIPNQYCFDEAYSTAQFVQLHGLSFRHGLWWKDSNRIAVPLTMTRDVISSHHDSLQAGHFGVRRTVELVRRHFWWPGLRRQVSDYVSSCPHCQANKSRTQKPYGLLQPLAVPDTRCHTWSLDFIVGLPLTARGNNAILTVVDKLTKLVVLVPCKNTLTAAGLQRLFLTHVESRFGTPAELISDRDPKLVGAYWSQFCQQLGIKSSLSTADHAESDGQTERANKVVGEVLRNFTSQSKRSWDDLLPYAEFSLNNAVNASTGYSPFYLMYGAHPRTLVTVKVPNTNLPALEQVFASRDACLADLQRLIRSAVARQKHYADRRRRPHTFDRGQHVWLSSRNLVPAGKGKRKLFPKFLGPFLIEEMVGENVAKLRLPDTWRIHDVFHVSLLKPWVGGADSAVPSVVFPVLQDGLPEYQVERILSYRDRPVNRRTVREYLVKWRGLPDESNCWLPLTDVPADALSDFLAGAGQEGEDVRPCLTT